MLLVPNVVKREGRYRGSQWVGYVAHRSF
jgi:hypothetical protein